MVDAIPMVMQVPAERAIPSSICVQACTSMLPARRSDQYLLDVESAAQDLSRANYRAASARPEHQDRW